MALRDGNPVSVPSFIKPKLIGWIVLVLFALYVFKSTLIFIPPGYVGALYDKGSGVKKGSLHEGLNFAIPFWQNIQLFDARLQEYTMSNSSVESSLLKDEALDAPTSDGQQVKVEATVLFRINPDHAGEIWKNIGVDYADKLVRPVSRSQIRMVISRYTAPVIYSEKRQEAETVMTKEITDILASKDIIVDKVLLRAVNFSPEYSQAIENKVIAEQKVKQAQYEVEVASQEAQAKIAEAKGMAEAQALQRQTLTAEYLQLEAIKKWDGHLPQVVGSQSTPFINIPSR
jgi:regulator of protease activity HflC (stomatin/prohibitin superfamily)